MAGDLGRARFYAIFFATNGPLCARLREVVDGLARDPEHVLHAEAVELSHRIKGDAKLIQFAALVALAQGIEDVLESVARGARGLTPRAHEALAAAAREMEDRVGQREAACAAHAPQDLLLALTRACGGAED